MKRGFTIVWVLLMLLTATSFLLGERHAGSVLILCAAGLKFSLVAWYFMDLRHSAFIWSAALLVMVGSILAVGIWAG